MDGASIYTPTLSTNSAETYGGGITNTANLTITSSTLSGNTVGAGAGAVYNLGTLTVTDSTIAGNSTADRPSYYYNAGGITNSGTATIDGSIVAGNTVAGNTGGDVSGNSCSGNDNLIGGTPLLAALGNYGGPTQTMPPLANSPALGAGGNFTDPISGDVISTDQRGFPLPSTPDIGAFQTNSITVNTLATDPVGPGQMSFTDATNLANAYGGNQSIGIDPSIITESNGTLSVGNVFSITAPITVNEGGSDTVTFSSASPVSVYDWSIALTDENGGALATQTVNGTSGNYVYSGAESLQINATVTAIVHASNSSISYLFPAVGAAVVPTAPDGLGVTFSSSTEIDFSWTDHSTIAVGDIIYESTDGGNTFYPIDEVNPVAAGSTNTYQATGLNSGSGYQFYITADGGYAESLPCTSITSSTTFVQPTLDVEGTGTVVEGQPYELDLTAEYPDGEPGAVQYWAINWNDGLGNSTSDIIDYYYPSGADPTQPLVVTHAFNSGISTPDVSVTAVDAVNGSFDGGLQAVTVTPIAPTLGLVSASGSTLTVNWSNSSSISTGTVVLLSTDGTNYFVADSVGAGITSDTISDLNLNTQYSVEVQTNSVNGVSDASNIEQVGTPDAAAPSIVVTPTNMPNVGESYNLTLSATYADNTPQAEFIAYFLVDWGDGQGQIQYTPSTPGDLVTISSPSYSGTTTSATATITAVATNGNTITTTFPMYFAPPAPTNVTSVLAGNTAATITWSGDDSITSTYVVQVLAPGSTTWVTLGTVDSSDETSPGSDEYSIADPNSGSGYLYSVTNTAPGAPSGAPSATPGSAGDSSTVESAITDPPPDAPYGIIYDGGDESGSDVTVTTTPSDAADMVFNDGDSVTFTVDNLPLHMSFSILVGGGISELPDGYSPGSDYFTITGPSPETDNQAGSYDWDDGMSVPDLGTMTSASFTVTGHMPDDNRTWTIGTPTIYSYPGSVGIDHGEVSVGGTSDVEVHFSSSDISDDSDVTLHVKGYDSGIVSVESTSVQLDSSGNGTLVIQGVSVGSTYITVEDAIGDEATAGVDVVAPGVISTGSETQGATYTANDMPGFTFSIGELSLTPVTVDYNTLGSTLPASLLGNLLAGSVTIDAGEMSQFVPFTVPDDGKIAPTRVAVVNLVVPGDTQPASTQMAVLNTDVPTIKMNGATDHAVIQLDPQADNGKLTKISMSANISPGTTLVSTVLTWFPSQFTIWLTDQIGAAGTDLGSLPGVSSDPISGSDSYTWKGKGPATVYGQDLSGSSDWDTTLVTLTVNVSVAATQKVAASTGSASNTSHGTANGLVIFVSAAGEVQDPNDIGIAEEILVGSGVNVSADWLGPLPAAAGDSMTWSYNWYIQGAEGDASTAKAIAGYDSGAALPANPSGSAPQVSLLTAADLQLPSIHYYYLASTTVARESSISVDATIGGASYHAETDVRVWTPVVNHGGTHSAPSKMSAIVNSGFLRIYPDLPVQFTTSVKTPTLFAPTVGAWHYTQIFTSYQVQITSVNNGVNTVHLSSTNITPPTKNGLDTAYVYGSTVPYSVTDPATHLNRVSAPADGSTQLFFNDAPDAQVYVLGTLMVVSIALSYEADTYIMYNPGVGDSIDVALQSASWGCGGIASPKGKPPSVTQTKNSHVNGWMPAPGEPTWERVLSAAGTWSPPLH